MTCPCNDTKRKMPGCDAGTPPVLEVSCGETPVLFHTVTIPASIGTLETMPPQPGAYRNARVIYEADKATYLYDSDGIPQLLVPDTEAIITEAVSQIPAATTTADGLMSAGDKTKLDNISSAVGDYSTTETVVGTWVDGKPIYRKVISIANPSTSNTDYGLVSNNVSTLVRLWGYMVSSDGTKIPAPQTDSSSTYSVILLRATGVLRGRFSYAGSAPSAAVMVVEYTKTTD